MMMNKITMIILLLIYVMHCYGQSGPEQFLDMIESNNKELKAARQYMEVQNINARTGLTPENPVFEYAYMPGNNPGMGTRNILGISQSFDFPTVYYIRYKIASGRKEISEFEYQTIRQDVLLKSKLLLYEYISLLKKEKEYRIRSENARKLFESYSQKLHNGNASIIEVNKAKVLNLSMQSRSQLLNEEIDNIKKELTMLNGGITPPIADMIYVEEPIEPLDTIKNQFLKMNPGLLLSISYIENSKLKIRLSKQFWLPDFEIGYEAETEPDGTYAGIRAGISVPLWKNKNSIKLARASYIYEQAAFESTREEYFAEIDKDYNRTLKYMRVLSNYDSTLTDNSDIGFIEKAFNAGHISIIEYITELSFYYDITDMYLETEKSYFQALAKLYSYRL